MTIDNEIYNRLADTWWDESGFLLSLTALIPPRLVYLQDVIIKKLGIDPSGLRTLDVGCGGGLLTEEFARLGFQMTGIDPSIASIDKAREHASQIGLDIDYRQGTGENLPFEESTFKMVYCCDVLEHVNNPEKVITEIVRVLEPGGIFFYDTINRTMGSKMVYIKLFQEWAWSSFMPNNLHDWNMFIKPEELISVMNRIGLLHHDIKGISPGVNPFKLVRVLRQCKKRAITYSELGRRVKMKVSNNTSIGYLGFAIKRK